MKIPSTAKSGGFTLVELLIGTFCGTLVFAGVITVSLALTRSFVAVEGYSMAAGDQMRMLDYIAMDARRATGWNSDGTTLTFNLPAYYDASGNKTNPQLDPATNAISYSGVGPVTVSYYRDRSANFVRRVNVNGTITTTTVARNVAAFDFNLPPAPSASPTPAAPSVPYGITFLPKFTRSASLGAIQGTRIYANTFLRNPSARSTPPPSSPSPTP